MIPPDQPMAVVMPCQPVARAPFLGAVGASSRVDLRWLLFSEVRDASSVCIPAGATAVRTAVAPARSRHWGYRGH